MAKFRPKGRRTLTAAKRHEELVSWVKTAAYRADQCEIKLAQLDKLVRTQLGYIQSQIENYRAALEPNIVNALKKHESAQAVKQSARLSWLSNLVAR